MSIRTTVTLIIVSFVVLGLGALSVTYLSPSTASMGDWGDYVGGMVGFVTLIWLVAGHIGNQIALRQTMKELQAQSELTQEIAGALTRIASGTQVQAGLYKTPENGQIGAARLLGINSALAGEKMGSRMVRPYGKLP